MAMRTTLFKVKFCLEKWVKNVILWTCFFMKLKYDHRSEKKSVVGFNEKG